MASRICTLMKTLIIHVTFSKTTIAPLSIWSIPERKDKQNPPESKQENQGTIWIVNGSSAFFFSFFRVTRKTTTVRYPPHSFSTIQHHPQAKFSPSTKKKKYKQSSLIFCSARVISWDKSLIFCAAATSAIKVLSRESHPLSKSLLLRPLLHSTRPTFRHRKPLS